MLDQRLVSIKHNVDSVAFSSLFSIGLHRRQKKKNCSELHLPLTTPFTQMKVTLVNAGATITVVRNKSIPIAIPRSIDGQIRWITISCTIFFSFLPFLAVQSALLGATITATS